MDAAVMQYLLSLMTAEIPKHLGNMLFPLADKPENYPSLISNSELQSLMIHQYVAVLKSCTQPFAGSLTGWSRMFGLPFWPVAAPISLSDDSK